MNAFLNSVKNNLVISTAVPPVSDQTRKRIKLCVGIDEKLNPALPGEKN